MPSPTYAKLLGVVTPYVDLKTAEGVIQRQLGTVTPDAFGPTDLKACGNRIVIALKLYVPDVARRDEMAGKLRALAA
jgi:hypothetical protein